MERCKGCGGTGHIIHDFNGGKHDCPVCLGSGKQVRPRKKARRRADNGK